MGATDKEEAVDEGKDGLGDCCCCSDEISREQCAFLPCPRTHVDMSMRHRLHRSCLNTWIDKCTENGWDLTCPLCRAQFSPGQVTEWGGKSVWSESRRRCTYRAWGAPSCKTSHGVEECAGCDRACCAQHFDTCTSCGDEYCSHMCIRKCECSKSLCFDCGGFGDDLSHAGTAWKCHECLDRTREETRIGRELSARKEEKKREELKQQRLDRELQQRLSVQASQRRNNEAKKRRQMMEQKRDMQHNDLLAQVHPCHISVFIPWRFLFAHQLWLPVHAHTRASGSRHSI